VILMTVRQTGSSKLLLRQGFGTTTVVQAGQENTNCGCASSGSTPSDYSCKREGLRHRHGPMIAGVHRADRLSIRPSSRCRRTRSSLQWVQGWGACAASPTLTARFRLAVQIGGTAPVDGPFQGASARLPGFGPWRSTPRGTPCPTGWGHQKPVCHAPPGGCWVESGLAINRGPYSPSDLPGTLEQAATRQPRPRARGQPQPRRQIAGTTSMRARNFPCRHAAIGPGTGRPWAGHWPSLDD